VTLIEALGAAGTQLHGHQQTTDAYLVGLAVHHGARLATLDKSLAALVFSGTQHQPVLEIVSTE
jgi:predicted nucleic acid-binding protein